ncbi:MAG: putative quinol monooxygenase [Candidatus Binataceae bacterium]
MIVLVAKITVKSGREQEFERTMLAAVPKVREEPGNHAYIFNRAKDNPRMFMFYEQYGDQAALEAHRAHLKEMGIDLAAFFDGPLVREWYDLIA